MTDVLRSWHETEFRASGPDRVTAVISTEGLARDGAIIKSDGWELAEYRKNPVVLWGHSDMPGGMSGGMPIARGENVRVEGKKLLADAIFDEDDPVAMQVKSKIDRGFIHATSVRWKPIKTSVRSMDDGEGSKRDVLVFERQALLEFSFVSIPADPRATIVRAVSGEPVDVTAIVAEAERIAEAAAREDEEMPTADEFLESIGRQKAKDAEEERSPACRQKGETRRECVERKIPELIDEGMDQDQAVAAAQNMCRKACDERSDTDMTTPVSLEDQVRDTVDLLDEAAVITDAEQDALRSLHSAIGARLGLDTEEQVAQLRQNVRGLVDAIKREPDPREVVVDVLSRMTGRSPERIRKEIAHG